MVRAIRTTTPSDFRWNRAFSPKRIGSASAAYSPVSWQAVCITALVDAAVKAGVVVASLLRVATRPGYRCLVSSVVAGQMARQSPLGAVVVGTFMPDTV